jgi:hypothetical protein
MEFSFVGSSIIAKHSVAVSFTAQVRKPTLGDICEAG